MKASVRWLNSLLEPGNLAPAEIEEALTNAGFPIDAREALAGGDVCLEVEITSNRGDCLSHFGLAREIAAVTGRTLVAPPAPKPGRVAGRAAEACRLDNRAKDACPRFTARVIRGARIAPSPAWLVERLESVGQRAINNAVDATNYLNFLFGQPAHAFDLAKLAGRSLVVRYAAAGEPLTTLDGKKRKLAADELVVADAERAQSLAGVIGGADSEVSSATTDIVLEAATWDPATIRRAARRHQVRTDAGHRFERIVDPRTIDAPARFAAALIAELTGGTLCEGMLDEGRAADPLRVVEMRPDRCRAIIGSGVDDATQGRLLAALGIKVERAPSLLRCTIPPWRPDLEREIDLIEEVARTHGLRHVPTRDRVTVAVRPPQDTERARRELGSVLAGLGFFETVTFSFTSPKFAQPWLPPGMAAIDVEDDRRAHEPTLRPSVLTGLLACRAANQNVQSAAPGSVRLFEAAAVFGRVEGTGHGGQGAGVRGVVESRNLGLLMDVPFDGKSASFEDRQRGVRLMRGVIEAVVHAMMGVGAGADLRIEPAEPHAPAMERGAYARVSMNGAPLGYYGLIDAAAARAHGLERPLAGGELNLDALLAAYPPRDSVAALPAFPSIDRDLSLLVAEATPWERVRTVVEGAKIDRLEAVSFVGAYRGAQAGVGRKSVTLRMRFRDPARTLRHDEVDPQVASVVAVAKRELGAELRAV
ncbi:MAG: phenylalanine--tRNA ligase subunit beta [Phycisphaerales bacterium]